MQRTRRRSLGYCQSGKMLPGERHALQQHGCIRAGKRADLAGMTRARDDALAPSTVDELAVAAARRHRAFLLSAREQAATSG